MERYDRERYENGGYDNINWRENRYDQDRGNRFDFRMRDDFDRDYYNRRAYNHREEDNQISNYRSYDENRGRSYARDFQGRGPSQGDLRRGYGISGYDGISDRYNTLNNPDNARDYGENDTYYGGGRGGFGAPGYGEGIREAFPGSHRGVPDTTYGLRNFGDDRGTGMGSSYGATNYGTGYGGGSSGSSPYSSSSGNYGGYGAMSGSWGSPGGRTPLKSDRGPSELGGF